MQQSVIIGECGLGRGLFAGRSFRPGELLFHFTGPEISLPQAIAKGDTEGNALQIGPTTYLDLEPPGVFANHSCRPNAGIRHHTAAHALRAIAPGEEICFDYSTTMSERRWTLRCRCGADSCRGLITDFHDLPPALQEHYLTLGIVQPFIIAELQTPSTHA